MNNELQGACQALRKGGHVEVVHWDETDDFVSTFRLLTVDGRAHALKPLTVEALLRGGVITYEPDTQQYRYRRKDYDDD